MTEEEVEAINEETLRASVDDLIELDKDETEKLRRENVGLREELAQKQAMLDEYEQGEKELEKTLE